jgi:AcrR family transcriptional regulator
VSELKSAIPPAGRRPSRGEKRRRAILDAASIVFLQKGYEKASLSEILTLSGGSRATIYQLFGNKDGLLEAMLVECCQAVLAPLSADAVRSRPPEEVLREMAVRSVDVLLSPANLALTRVVLAEGRKFPHLTRVFHEQGFVEGNLMLGAYLSDISRGGAYHIPDPERYARIFFSMAWGDAMFRLAADMPDPPTREEVLGDVEVAVRIFLEGIRADGTALPAVSKGL